MVRGITSSGFEFRVPEGIKTDYRFLKAYKKLRAPDSELRLDGILELVGSVFCDETEEERFIRHLADENGRADVELVFNELGEILVAASGEDAGIKKS